LGLEILIALNAAAYGALAAGIVVLRRLHGPDPTDSRAAFGLLEKALRKAIPDLKDGFTWREGVGQAKRKGLDLNWQELDRSLQDYEAYRYGKGPDPGAPRPEMLKLLRELRRSS